MADVPSGYRAIPEEDQKKANVFFERGRTVADTGNYEYAIEMYIQGLSIDPENIDAHKALREIALKRKASGNKDMGMFERRKYPTSTKDDKQNMLNAERLLAYDPGDKQRMVTLLQSAQRAGFYDTVLWIGPILQKANADQKPNYEIFIILKDTYKQLEEFKLATEACHYARTLRPDDMDLQTELKNLAAQQTMKGGKYGSAKSFRESVRDKDKQDRYIQEDRDVQSSDILLRGVHEAEEEYNANPEDLVKFGKLIDAIRRTEDPTQEERGIELLNAIYERTNQFKWRQRIGEIRMHQYSRQERTLRTALQAEPNNAELQQQYKDFAKQRAKDELAEFQLILQHYPTDSAARFQVAQRMFLLGQFQESIPVFQQVRNDPKFRTPANILLGRAFLEAGFADEAVDTLKSAIDEYTNKGDERSIDMFYWYGRALEAKNDTAAALATYSQVVQWNFNYRDVQQRIKRLRTANTGPAPAAG